jgi:hypothetical protein
MKISHVILAVMLICSFNGATTELELLPITYNAKVSSFLVAEFVEDAPKGRPIDLANIESPKTAKQVLAKYYWLLKSAKYNDAAKLYDVKDGSQASFIKAIKTKSLDLAGFSNLAEVRVKHIQRWNSFVYYWLTFKSDKGQKLSLRQELNCTIECKLVFNKIFYTDDVIDLLEYNYFAYKTLAGKKYPVMNNDELKGFSKITIKHPKFIGDASKSYPLSFYLNIDKTYKDKVVSRQSDCKSEYKDKVQLAVCLFINKFDSINVLEPEKLSIFMDEIRGGASYDPVSINSFSGNKIKKAFYQDKSFVHWVKGWSSVKLLGSIENDDTYFLFLRPLFTDGREAPMQIVTFNKVDDPNYSKVIFGDNLEDTYGYFQNSLFMTELSSVMNK